MRKGYQDLTVVEDASMNIIKAGQIGTFTL